MNERQFGNRIRQVLNTGTTLDREAAERLRAAREQALALKKVEKHAPLYAWAGSTEGTWGSFTEISLRLVVPILFLALGLFAIYAWQQETRVAELVEIDAQLLTDDLPIDAYLDKGFEAWLNTREAP